MKIPQHEPWLGEDEYAAIKDCFDQNWITEGAKSEAFMQQMRELTGAKYCVLAPNGTLALYLGLRALGIGPGDEVIVPDCTFVASATSVEMVGATPIFCDVDADDFQFNCEEARRVLSPRTKAIMPVHLFGDAADMTKIMAFAQEHDLLVIEDACQAVGVHHKGQHCGTFGEVGVFSFFSDKTITMGEGGLVVTDSPELYDRLRYLRNQGRLERGTFQHPELGYNFRTTDILTAIGLVQLQKLPEVIRRKQRLFQAYREQLSDVRLLEGGTDTHPHIPFRACILVEDEPAASLMRHLSEQGIQPRSFFYPLHSQPCFAHLEQNLDFPNSARAYEHGICLPCFPTMTLEQVTTICETIRSYFHVRSDCTLL